MNINEPTDGIKEAGTPTVERRARVGWVAGAVVAGMICSYLGNGPKHRNGAGSSSYVFTAHDVRDGVGLQEDIYTVTYGPSVITVKYAESQTSTAKPGDFPGTGLHPHFSYSHPDLSQVPPIGVPVPACVMDKERDHDGDLVIAIQPTPAPCISRNGDTLHYELSPNGPMFFTYVNFDIITEKVR